MHARLRLRHGYAPRRLALRTCRLIDPSAAGGSQEQRLLFAAHEAPRARIRFHGAQGLKPCFEGIDLRRIDHPLTKNKAEGAFKERLALCRHGFSGDSSGRHHRVGVRSVASLRLSGSGISSGSAPAPLTNQPIRRCNTTITARDLLTCSATCFVQKTRKPNGRGHQLTRELEKLLGEFIDAVCVNVLQCIVGDPRSSRITATWVRVHRTMYGQIALAH